MQCSSKKAINRNEKEKEKDRNNKLEDYKMQYDENDITTILKQVFEPGDLFEIRCLDATVPNYRKEHTESGYFTYENIDKVFQELSRVQARGVYFTPNPVSPDLLARSANRIQAAKRDMATTDADILSRRWLLVDCDPVRRSGISANEEEHKAAEEKAENVAAFLTSLGWPDPIMLDSGNGAQLMYRIDLPTDDDGLVQACLNKLAKQSDDQVKIDTTVHNPSRIWRLSGTPNCKGDEIEGRVYRMAKIKSIPPDLQIVPREKLEEFAAISKDTSAPEPEVDLSGILGSGSSAPTDTAFDLDRWIAQYCPDAEGPFAWKDGRKWIFPVCPFNVDHDNRSAVITQQSNGAIGFTCHHDGCAGKDWHDLRSLRQPEPAPEPSIEVDLSRLLEKLLGAKPVIRAFAMPSKTAGEIVDEIDIESDDPNELLQHRFLCRCGGLLFIGPSGFGKSSFLIQAALIWSMGMEMMGINPKKPLKILIVQAENDDRDVAEQIVGAVKGFSENHPEIDPELINAALKNIDIVRESALTGEEFILSLNKKLDSYSEDGRRDLVIIDPLFAYCGCDVSDQGLMSKFLRNGMNPRIDRHNVGILISHHTNKPPKEAVAPSPFSLAYAGAGTAELTNWARAVLVISQDSKDDSLFILTAAKRGKRLRWEDGSLQKYMRHATDGSIYWNEVPPPVESETAQGNNVDLLAKAVSLAHDECNPEPVADYLSRLQFDLGIGEKKARNLIRAGLERGVLNTIFTNDEEHDKRHLKHIYKVSQPQGNLLLAGIF